MSVSCKSTLLTRENNNIEKLKKTLYDISTHLHVGRDGYTCKTASFTTYSARSLYSLTTCKAYYTHTMQPNVYHRVQTT